MMAHYVGFSMPMFADNLMGFIQDRQIVDETGMTGHFEFTIAISASVLQGGPAGPDDNRADAVRPAIQSLGFRLVPKKEPLDFIVIDHLEKPSANYKTPKFLQNEVIGNLSSEGPEQRD